MAFFQLCDAAYERGGITGAHATAATLLSVLHAVAVGHLAHAALLALVALFHCSRGRGDFRTSGAAACPQRRCENEQPPPHSRDWRVFMGSLLSDGGATARIRKDHLRRCARTNGYISPAEPTPRMPAHMQIAVLVRMPAMNRMLACLFPSASASALPALPLRPPPRSRTCSRDLPRWPAWCSKSSTATWARWKSPCPG